MMAKTLLGLKHLTSLALNDNNLGSAAGPVLAQVISQNPKLKELNLGDIGVEEEGIRAVLKAIANIRPGTLEHLDVSASELSGSEKFMKPLCAIMRAQSASLKHVKLEDNELKSRGAAKLLTALEGAKNLEYLNLTNNHLGTKVAAQLVAFLKSHPHLKTVHLNGNHFTAAQLEEIKGAISEGENKDALQEMSDNDEEEDDTEEESEQDEEEEEEETPAVQDASVDALAEKVAALGK
jgi:Ran GTPase-activating protein (RanGAP) involved in mRNA processing and transport